MVDSSALITGLRSAHSFEYFADSASQVQRMDESILIQGQEPDRSRAGGEVKEGAAFAGTTLEPILRDTP